MAFPAASDVKAEGYLRAKRVAAALKTYCQQTRDTMAAGNVSGNVAITLHERLVADKATFTAIAATNGIGAYAQDQEANGGLDIVAEFNAMIAAMNSAGSWMINNVNTTGWVTFGAGGVTTKTFTPAQTAGLRAELDAVIATIG